MPVESLPPIFFYKSKFEFPLGLEEIIPSFIEFRAEKTIPFSLKKILWNYHYTFSPEQELLEVTYRVVDQEALESSYRRALSLGKESAFAAFCTTEGFFPPSLLEKKTQEQWHHYKKTFILTLLFFLTTCFFYCTEQASHLKAATAEIALLLHQCKKEREKLAPLLLTACELKKEEAALSHLFQEQARWPQLLTELHEKLPPRFVWITKLSPITETPSEKTEEKKIKALAIEGLYLENPRQGAVVEEWVHNLKTSPLFALKDKKEKEIILSLTPSDHTAYAYPFKLVLPLSSSFE